MGTVAALAVLLAPRLARADEAQALELARAPFDAGQYGDAHERLARLLDGKLESCETAAAGACRLVTPELIERARALDAAALLALRKNPDADGVIAAILRANPNYVPSPAMFPQEVVDRFTFVRGSMAAELRKIVDEQTRVAEARRLAAQKAREDDEKWIAALEKLASQERQVQANSRWIALVPFGIGQFQNGDTPWGVTFAVTEAAAAGTSLVAVALANSLASTVPSPALLDPTNARLSTYATVNRVSFTAWGALTLAGIIHAQVNFVPERVTFHDRQVPPRPKIVPLVAPVAHGATLGLAGTF
jgi:hypothetical protein